MEKTFFTVCQTLNFLVCIYIEFLLPKCFILKPVYVYYVRVDILPLTDK